MSYAKLLDSQTMSKKESKQATENNINDYILTTGIA
jgi:hypothetical protein